MNYRAHFLVFALAIAGLTSCKSRLLTTASKQVNTQESALFYELSNFPSPDQWALATDTDCPLISAHRGKPEIAGFVENSVESIEKLVESGSFILELDVAKSIDGVLFLFHDDDLDRMTRNKGEAAKRPWSELDTMRLIDEQGNLTAATIPSLEEALRIAKGKALFSLDRKKGVSFQEISETVSKLGLLPDVALILYNTEDFIEWANQTVIGPISHAAEEALELEQIAQRTRELYSRVGVSPFKEKKIYPNSGFLGVGLPDEKILALAKTLGIKATVGTFGDLDQRAEATKGETYRDLIEAGVSIIATNRPLLAHKALYGK